MTGQRTAYITPSQHRVLVGLLTDGPSNREIAARLHLTEHTVKCHMKALLEAFDARSRTEMVCAFYRGAVKVRLVGDPL